MEHVSLPLFHPLSGELYAVNTDGLFFKGIRPISASDNWMSRSTTIGSGGWVGFKFLFFANNGDLYAVDNDGKFRFASPPSNADDNWMTRTKLIGTGGWGNFNHLFFPTFNPF